MSILKRGVAGAPVRRLQEALGIDVDGDFGPATEKALKSYQESNGLSVDGVAGPDTFTAMGLHELVLLRVGSRGEAVKKMQQDLGIDADGRFGPGTKKAVVAFQEANGLVADGLAGPATLAKMNSFAEVITEEVIQKSEIRPEEEDLPGEGMPDIDGIEPIKGAVADGPPKKSVWGRVKGWFS